MSGLKRESSARNRTNAAWLRAQLEELAKSSLVYGETWMALEAIVAGIEWRKTVKP